MNQIPETLPDLAYSPKWQRAIHMLVDASLAAFGVVAVLKGAVVLVDSEAVLLQMLAVTKSKWAVFLLPLPYYLFFEVGFRTTPAKFLTGSVVTTADGGVPTRRQLLGRTLLRFIPLEPLSFFDRDGKGWHDAGSKTYVVRRSSVKSGVQANA